MNIVLVLGGGITPLLFVKITVWSDGLQSFRKKLSDLQVLFCLCNKNQTKTNQKIESPKNAHIGNEHALVDLYG